MSVPLPITDLRLEWRQHPHGDELLLNGLFLGLARHVTFSPISQAAQQKMAERNGWSERTPWRGLFVAALDPVSTYHASREQARAYLEGEVRRRLRP